MYSACDIVEMLMTEGMRLRTDSRNYSDVEALKCPVQVSCESVEAGLFMTQELVVYRSIQSAGVNDKGGDGTDCVEVSMRADAAKFTNIIPAQHVESVEI